MFHTRYSLHVFNLMSMVYSVHTQKFHHCIWWFGPWKARSICVNAQRALVARMGQTRHWSLLYLDIYSPRRPGADKVSCIVAPRSSVLEPFTSPDCKINIANKSHKSLISLWQTQRLWILMLKGHIYTAGEVWNTRLKGSIIPRHTDTSQWMWIQTSDCNQKGSYLKTRDKTFLKQPIYIFHFSYQSWAGFVSMWKQGIQSSNKIVLQRTAILWLSRKGKISLFLCSRCWGELILIHGMSRHSKSYHTY